MKRLKDISQTQGTDKIIELLFCCSSFYYGNKSFILKDVCKQPGEPISWYNTWMVANKARKKGGLPAETIQTTR